MPAIEPKQSTCRFGIAHGDITPPVGMYHRMWGAARHDRSTGIHRPLAASVLVFQHPQANGVVSADDQQLLVTIDHCILDCSEVDRLKTAVILETGLPRESILLTHSHTHGAGLMSRDRATLPGGDLIPDYLDRMHATIATLAGEGLKSVTDVTITYGVGRCELAANRDSWDEENDTWVCGLNPNGPSDDTVLVARVTDRDDRCVATIVNYACHPTTLAWNNQQISPDYPGAMRETVEAVTDAPCVFLQGASGDLGPREGYVGDSEVADRNGRELGYAALAALTALAPPNRRYCYRGPVVSGATIGEWIYAPASKHSLAESSKWRVTREPLSLPYRPELPTTEELATSRSQLCQEEETARQAGDELRAGDLRAMVERATRNLDRVGSLPEGEYPLDIVVWRMGHAIWVALQGEPYHLLQTSLRDRFPDAPIIVITLCNDWGSSYLPPAQMYGTGVYQETIAVLEKGSLERVTDAIATRIEQCMDKR